MTLWHIGNTTVRSPYRLKEALKVLKNSEFHGNLLGKEREQGFALLLNEKAVVRVDRIIQTPDSDSSDLGRKWRSALGQLGFVVKHLTIKHKVGIDPKLKSLVSDIKSLSGIPYEITPNGNNIIWRAFLAVDFMANTPWDARRFKIDQDFLPLSHAPAGEPDMIFEFEEYILVVEVTLKSSSRQEAAEGEPVRRHVAKIAEQFESSEKRVYCLFIAPYIDSNTAETFKIGNWYKEDDTTLKLQIVPITLDKFIDLFEAGFGFTKCKLTPAKILELIINCRALSNNDAPKWKKEISGEIKRLVLRMKQQ